MIQKRKFKMIVEYVGSFYHGMQKQQSEKNTIAEKIEEAIFKLSGENVEINYAGRTDAGVSACGQVVDFEISNQRISESNVLFGLNSFLFFEKISIKSVEIVDGKFNSRFDAKLRTYRYYVYNNEARSAHKMNTHFHVPRLLNVEKMRICAKFLIGRHDFSSFRKKTDSNKQNPERTILNIDIIENCDEIIFEISAKSFLHNMVRIIVGTLIEFGLNDKGAIEIKKILEEKDRKKAGKTAPAHGLMFFKVDY